MDNHIFIIDENDSGVRIDCYLSNLFADISRTKIQSLIKSGKVLINEKSCKSSYVIQTDDKIKFEFDDVKEIKIKPEKIEIETLYEDEYIAIINKPSGMLTHPVSNEKSGTLVNALLYKYGCSLSDLNGEYRRGIVHRLDRNTSGLLIITKNNTAHEKISEMMKERKILKRYRTIVKGVMNENVVIDKPIGRSRSNPAKMCVAADGKPSVTEACIIKRFDNATYLDINLKTGRTHQIRVHLSCINHPVYNDTLYGFGKMKIKTDGQVLQSYKLVFTNPFNGKLIDMEIEPDEKIKKILNCLEQREVL